MDVTRLDFSQIHPLLLNGSVSCSRIVRDYLKNVNEGFPLNAFISILAEDAQIRAQKIDAKIRQKRAGKLAGLVVAVKDNILVKGIKTTCSSKMLADFVAPYNATVIDCLLKEDAILIGKTNMDEFAMGSSNENSFFGAVKNPIDHTKVPGGSSGGSAAAVASRQAMAALGSDTGGSIRQPAAFCGLVGLKPTYGSVSRYGLIAYASSFDQIGPIARSVEDCAKIFSVIAGHDSRDSTSSTHRYPAQFFSDIAPVSSLKIGVPKQFFSNDIEPDVKRNIESSVEKLRQKGAQIISVSLPHADYSVPAYYIIATAEASSNLARFDGVGYGFRSDEAKDIGNFYAKNRSQGFGEEVKRRILLGTFVLSRGYYERYYRKAQTIRSLIRRDFSAAFQKCDFLITPTSPTTAFPIAARSYDPLAMYLSDVFTVAANLTGLPALSIPCGQDRDGLPVGLQLMAPRFAEPFLFSVAKAVEKFCPSGEIENG
ncbi:MAG: Asp-tRNA(Asn)/Glu-tRNA(Gln) amidotransferase subunit GatA [Calditrichaeota bacterium]|nr:Asp-tRNA(Asn)/Glu-tRNA(Gln) amidotransferase subunit GatA [Calditrichota bacterium]